jgi:hypothetical protein
MGLGNRHCETTVIHAVPYLCEMLILAAKLRNIFNWKS